jgi:hypothetical protein
VLSVAQRHAVFSDIAYMADAAGLAGGGLATSLVASYPAYAINRSEQSAPNERPSAVLDRDAVA